MYRLALALTADSQLTEKCLAEALCRAVREEPRARAPSSENLKRIVVESALNVLEVGGRTGRASLHPLGAGIREDWALQAIRGIQTGLRIPFVLAACEHVPPPEVARLLGWTVDKVKIAIGEAAVQLTTVLRRSTNPDIVASELVSCRRPLEQSACAG